MKITVDQIMDMDPCDTYPESRVRELVGDGLTRLEILDLDIPLSDSLMVLLHSGIIPDLESHIIACDLAESVLPIYESKFPNDQRVRVAIETKRRWVDGDETVDGLQKLRALAGDAAWLAMNKGDHAAQSAAWAAWTAALERPAAILTWDAVVSAFHAQQYQIICAVLEKLEGAESDDL